MDTEYHKQETLTSSNPASAPNKLIRVVAPSNLPGGYQIDVQTDSDPPIMFTATVPKEGVKMGEVFLTSPPPGYTPPYPQIEAPIGHWKDGLFDVFSYGLCHPQAWLSLCCTEIAIGQVMHRFRLTWLGNLVPSNTPVSTFKTVLAIALSWYVFDYSLGLYIQYNRGGIEEVGAIWAKFVVGVLFLCWSIYALYKTRKHVRMTYSIPEERCIGYEDCVCSTFCSICTVSQIARHTGDYENYPSLCCSNTGLPDHAPMVV